VLFDFDDTLFDHTRALVAGLRELRRVERRLEQRPLRSIVREYERLLDLIQPGTPGGPRTHPEARQLRFQQLDRWLGGSGDPSEALRWSEAYRAIYQASRFPVAGAVPLLRRLKEQVSVGIVTNNHTEEQQEKIRVLGLGRWIDFLVTSEDVGVLKPAAAIFEAALKEAGVAAREAVMVGDNWASDVVGATLAGIRPVWLQRRGRRPAGFPQVEVLRSFSPSGRAAQLLLQGGVRPSSPSRRPRARGS
jgi:HAD superfamily hydrolase (TIGR01549 family)